jgi:hypothetical protein
LHAPVPVHKQKLRDGPCIIHNRRLRRHPNEKYRLPYAAGSEVFRREQVAERIDIDNPESTRRQRLQRAHRAPVMFGMAALL